MPGWQVLLKDTQSQIAALLSRRTGGRTRAARRFGSQVVKGRDGSLIAAILVATLCASAHAQSTAHPLPYQSKDQHVGVVNCANSLCHGSVSQWKDANILQNEYITWSRVDKHASRAYRVLFNAQSARIAKNLSLKSPAHESKICLDCHAHNVSEEKRGERFKFDDAISCEACHGPAERWLRSHVEAGATHQTNVTNGLYPTSDPVAQARLCLSCHFGNRDKFVTHRIMGAGHPRMSFELETFAALAPAHYVIDADWQKRKGEWDGVRVWAIGQTIAASELLDILADPKRGRDGLFPELTLFDCHACHHPMSEARWKPRQGIGPGRIRLNDSNLLMVKHIVRTKLPARFAAYSDQVQALHRAAAGESGDDAMVEARKLMAILESVRNGLARETFVARDLLSIVQGLISDADAGQFADYAGAEQATMAMSSVLHYMVKSGQLNNASAINRALSEVHKTLVNDERFSEARFKSAISNLRALIK